MTVLAAHPGPAADPACELRFAPHAGTERRVLFWSLAAAAMLHGLALLLPLPERAAAVAAPPADEPLEVHPLPIPPPPVEPPRVSTPVHATRRVPLPVERVPDSDPVEEPAPPVDSPSWDTAADEPLFTAEPPPVTGPVDERTAGLTRPYGLLQPEPEYPPLAIAARREGVVVLRAVITADGAVEEIEVQSAPQPDLGFSDAAVAAVRRWRYEPGRLNGRAVAVSMQVVVEFHLR